MNTRTIAIYTFAAIIVIVLGALLGWYFFVRGQDQATNAADAARGFSAPAPFGPQTGSTYENMLSQVSGGSSSSLAPAKILPQLWHADKAPVAGFAFTGAASSSVLSYVERGNGYVFAGDASQQTIARLTDTLMPKIYEAFFGTSGEVVERAIDAFGNITTFTGTVGTTTDATGNASTTNALSGVYLDRGITAITVNPSTGELFYLESAAPRVAGIRVQWDGNKEKSAFSSAIADWRVTWVPDGRIILLTSPADGVPGYAYTLQGDGSLATLVGATPGLTVLAQPSSSALLYSQSTGNGVTLYARVSASASVVALPVRTVTDKCVWASGKDPIVYCAVPSAPPVGNFLDDWYKGVSHTTDAWWRIDVSADKAVAIYTPAQNLSLDVKDPVIDATGSYIAFSDARDGSLWILRINK